MSFVNFKNYTPPGPVRNIIEFYFFGYMNAPFFSPTNLYLPFTFTSEKLLT